MLLGAVALALGIAQLVPIERSNPPVTSDLAPPPGVESILRRSCYDCHSHETSWPWYAHVAPVSWIVAKDVHDAREEMNFSDWGGYRLDKRERLLEDMLEEVEEGEMPPRYYLLVHPQTRIAGDELETLRAWVRDGAPRG